jgi:hypothetical protein
MPNNHTVLIVINVLYLEYSVSLAETQADAPLITNGFIIHIVVVTLGSDE